jgi:beta-lactamase class A
MKPFIIGIFTLLLLWGCSSKAPYADLQKSLNEYAEGYDARIGIAVIIDGKDTIAVNGYEEFPMLSVYKFPIALALADSYRERNMTLTDQIAILPEDLHPDTYSPMTEKILASSAVMTDTLMMPTVDLLGYMLQQSDNNASDIALRIVGSAENVTLYLRQMGITDVHVRNSEAEMHNDNTLCYANSTTPIAMAALMDRFDRNFTDSISLELKRLMETCSTGSDRLPKPLGDIVIGHKTGTGFTLPDGKLMAVNDAGYVHLPNGHNYSIAVFIKDSGYDMMQTEKMIADISEIVLNAITLQLSADR